MMNGVIIKRGIAQESTREVVEHPSQVKGEYQKVSRTVNLNRAHCPNGGHNLVSLCLYHGQARNERGGSCQAEKVGEGERLRSKGRNMRAFKISSMMVYMHNFIPNKL